ncbi:MAG: hypothetical protein H0T80_07855 [Betaproteobacteria bacterium]|nr:hypothetical protein [Betaproteobacteria bacterium]MBA3775679.1 hypothetical protein [Betaproteobacteria bacterium]
MTHRHADLIEAADYVAPDEQGERWAGEVTQHTRARAVVRPCSNMGVNL